MLLSHHRVLHQDDVLLLVNGRSWRSLAPLHVIVDVSSIAVDDNVLSLGYPSSEGGPIGGPTMPGPRTRDGVNALAEGEEGDRKAVHENRAEDDKSDDRLNGLCQEFGLGLRVLPLLRVRKLVDGKG